MKRRGFETAGSRRNRGDGGAIPAEIWRRLMIEAHKDLEPVDFDGFLENLQTDLADILRVDTLVLVMETATKEGTPELGGPLTMVPVGTVARAIAGGRRGQPSGEVILRRVANATAGLHGGAVASEALIPLDLGPNRMPALLLMGSDEPGRFSAAQGTDLLRFFGQAFRLALLRWLEE